LLNVKLHGDSYKQNPIRNSKVFTGVKYFSQKMESLFKPYFLFGGTLLGKKKNYELQNIKYKS
jgi:hypothetical protein